MEHVGELVRYHRGRVGMTQEELAEKAGISPAALVRLEGGEVKRPRAGTLGKLAGALGVDPQEFTRIGAGRSGPGEHGAGGGIGQLTAVFEKGEEGWWVATCPEIPEAITQGRTVEEARENLKDAIRMELEIRREEAEEDLAGRDVIREQLALS